MTTVHGGTTTSRTFIVRSKGNIRNTEKAKNGQRWKKKFQILKKSAKSTFYKRMVNELIEKNHNQWYSQYKRLTNQGKTDTIVVEEISHLSDIEQAEKIADHIAAVSQEYEHIRKEDIEVPKFDKSTTPHIPLEEVYETLLSIKTKKSTAPGDVPAKLVKRSAKYLAAPLADIINTGIRLGEWPDIYKAETITPVPKVNPPKLLDDLRPISNLFTYCKVGEKIISQMIIEDMVKTMDPSQFGNLKNTSITHYLISLIHRIMSSLDNNSRGEIFANCVTLFDYRQAFSRQCHKLGVKSFLRNGVRPSLIPFLVNYFQGRHCQIKWRGQLSKKRLLPGSGAQGSIIGNLEYLSQTNNNSDHIPSEDKWKWVDDLTAVEVINMINIGLSSYNFRQHVASDIPVHGQYVDPQNLKTQKYIATLDAWSEENKMQLNKAKTKIMLINFTKNYQFVSRIKLKDSVIEQVKEAKVLGTIISDTLSWNANCARLTKKCNMRLQLLRQVASFGTDERMMKLIYIQIIRVILEGSCQVWHGSLTKKNRRDLERCQKLAMKIILPTHSYKSALQKLDLETLEQRREKLTSRFSNLAKNHDKLKSLFRLNMKSHTMNTRNKRTFLTNAHTDRFMNSPIMKMQRLLNKLKHD